MPDVQPASTGATMVQPDVSTTKGQKVVGKEPVTKIVTKETTGKAGEKVEAPAFPEKRSYKIKVLDQEEELSLDDNEIKTYIQKAKGADRKFEDAARARKEADARIKAADEREERLKKDAFSALREMGLDPRKLSEDFLAQELEREMMDPKDRELQETKARLAKIEAEREAGVKASKEREESEAMTKRVAALKDSLATKIGAVLKDSSLPNSPQTVARIASYMQYLAKNEIPFTIDGVRDAVIGDYKSEFSKVFAQAEPKQIAEILGEEVLKKIRAWDNARVQGVKTKSNGSVTPNRYESKKRVKTIDEDNLERFGTLYNFPED